MAGQLKDTGNTTTSITLASNRFTEIEYSVQATANATAGGDYCFRLYNTTGSATLNGYTYAQARVSGTTAIAVVVSGTGEESGGTGSVADGAGGREQGVQAVPGGEPAAGRG